MRSVTWSARIRLAIIGISTGVLVCAPTRPSASTAGVDLAVSGRANATSSIAADARSVAVAWTSGKGLASEIHVEVRR